MEKEKKVKVNSEYLKDRKTIFTIFCLSIAFILTIILGFGTSFFFRPLDNATFWGDLAISFALCVYCLYFGVPEATDLYKKKKDGRYQNAEISFLKVRDDVSKRDNDFNQWLENYYVKNRDDYFLMILSLHGSINKQVLDLDRNELSNLSHPYKKDWKDTEFEGRKTTYFRSMNDEQIEIVKEIFDGKIKVERIPNDYFKTLNGKVVANEYITQCRLKKKQTWHYAFLIIYRIIMVFAFAFVFSIFGVQIENAQSGSEILDRVITTISRIWTMLSSFVYGFSLGKIMVMNEASTIEYKTRTNEMFINDKEFKAISNEDLARKEYEDYEKNTIKGEIVENVKQLNYNKE